jgi:hypothetical protein
MDNTNVPDPIEPVNADSARERIAQAQGNTFENLAQVTLRALAKKVASKKTKDADNSQT